MRRRGVEVGKLEPPRSSSTETLLPLGTCLCFLGDECRIRGCGALWLAPRSHTTIGTDSRLSDSGVGAPLPIHC